MVPGRPPLDQGPHPIANLATHSIHAYNHLSTSRSSHRESHHRNASPFGQPDARSQPFHHPQSPGQFQPPSLVFFLDENEALQPRSSEERLEQLEEQSQQRWKPGSATLIGPLAILFPQVLVGDEVLFHGFALFPTQTAVIAASLERNSQRSLRKTTGHRRRTVTNPSLRDDEAEAYALLDENNNGVTRVSRDIGSYNGHRT